MFTGEHPMQTLPPPFKGTTADAAELAGKPARPQFELTNADSMHLRSSRLAKQFCSRE